MDRRSEYEPLIVWSLIGTDGSRHQSQEDFIDVIDYMGRPGPTLWRSSGGQRARNYARISRIVKAVDSERGNRCARLERVG